MNDDPTAPPPSCRVLLVQAPDPLRDALADCLLAGGLSVQAQAPGEPMPAEAPDLVLVSDPPDALAAIRALRAEPVLGEVPLLLLAPDPRLHWEAIAAGADEVLPEDAATTLLLDAIRARAARARLAAPRAAASPVARDGALRRGEFLAQLDRALGAPGDWRVLLAVRLDQQRTLGEALGQAAAYELEQAVAARLAGELEPGDAHTLWMAFGFGVLVQRDGRAAVEDLAARLCRAVAAAPFELRGQAQAVTASVGVALPPAGAGAGDADRWFAAAHAAQAIAHRLGGNRFDGVLTREHGGMPAERVLIIREWVKDAASGENVLVEFQPALPLQDGGAGLYSLQAKLRDYRAPLAGVPRHEYLTLAREARALPMIDRMSLFAGFESVEAERAQGRGTRVLVAVDLASVDEAQLRWLEAEARRRRACADGVLVEVEVDAVLARPELAAVVQRIEELGLVIALSEPSGDLQRIARLQRFPAGLLRLPLRAVESVPAARFAELLAPWRASGRSILVDGVPDVARVRALWDLRVDHAQGDALAASGPRLDYEFTAPAG